MSNDSWYIISASKKEIAKEREKAQRLKRSDWWKRKLSEGLCHYCSKTFKPSDLTMDHIVPVARGGKSNPGNVVPACKSCNASKKLETPVERLLEELAKGKGSSEGENQ